MEKSQKKKFLLIIEPLIIICLLCAMVLTSVFYSLDSIICDRLYTEMNGVKRDIRIIAVDEETLEEYGSFTTWSREKSAELVELLCQDNDTSPLVIGFDFLFTGDTDPDADYRLVEACRRACPVVFASNVVYRGKTKQDSSGEMYFDVWNVDMVEEPYAALSQTVDSGFTNAYVAEDGFIRYTKLFESYQGSKESFPWIIYNIYQTSHGREAVIPEMNDAGQLNFFFSGRVGEYSHVSMKSVLDGTVPVKEFKDCIVLVGAFAPGFQDSYLTAAERGNPMYGVEIQANIIQALMDGKTALGVPLQLYLAVACSLVCIFFLIAKKQRLIPVILESVVLIILHMYAGRILALNGRTIPQIYFIFVIFLLMVYFVIEKYLIEKYRRKKMLSAFRKYVAPQVVDELEKDDSFNMKLGGEKRDVAVLFVDIRGFTPLSESLEPEQVVSILNEYLALTTSCILNNYGMLDKFIGDATMATFNASFDLDDYVFRAVKAAADMRDGADTLAEKLQAQFGKKVSFGIGVNCGEAVVGNIGCEFRMDYTAIGDTVNTAARLESRAGADEILISEAVYESLKDRITAEKVGEMELKGKSKAVMVYRVIKINEEKINA